MLTITIIVMNTNTYNSLIIKYQHNIIIIIDNHYTKYSRRIFHIMLSVAFSIPVTLSSVVPTGGEGGKLLSPKDLASPQTLTY